MPSHSKCGTANTKLHSIDSKIKQRNKRKNRKKRKQKSQYHHDDIPKMLNIPTYADNGGRQIKVDKAANDACSQNQMAVSQMWATTYEKIIRWQCQHRIEYWKNLAVNREKEIQRLNQMLINNDNANVRDTEETTDTINTDESSNQTDLESESYLKFLEITLRHRQERKNIAIDETSSQSD